MQTGWFGIRILCSSGATNLPRIVVSMSQHYKACWSNTKRISSSSSSSNRNIICSLHDTAEQSLIRVTQQWPTHSMYYISSIHLVHKTTIWINLQWNCSACEHPENSILRAIPPVQFLGLILICWVIIGGFNCSVLIEFWSLLPRNI